MADEDEEWLISVEKTKKDRFLKAAQKAGLAPSTTPPFKPDKEAEAGAPKKGWREHLIETIYGGIRK